ncbi:MAG: PAS domain S-box protein [Gammaproteobacteria bacterium]|nr:PAS domain S-box protein [Gammaproteobacteria bacterium]
MAESTFGICAAEAIGQNISLLIPERFRAVQEAAMARVLREGGDGLIGRRLEVVVQRADGSEFDADLVVSTADSAEGRIVIGFLRDERAENCAGRAGAPRGAVAAGAENGSHRPPGRRSGA